MINEKKRISEYENATKSKYGDLEFVPLHQSDLFDRDFNITGAEFLVGEYGEFVNICVNDGGDPFVVTSGSPAIVRILTAVCEDEGFPVVGKFVKRTGKSGRTYYAIE